MNNHQTDNNYDRYITRTLTCLSLQFLFTFLGVALIACSDAVRYFVIYNSLPLFVAGAFGGLITIIYMTVASKQTELQLCIFTFFETILVCVITAMFSYDVIIAALFCTFGVVSGLSCCALTTKNNHTGAYSMLYSGLCCLLVMFMFNVFFRTSLGSTIALYFGTIVFMGLLVCDVQYFLKCSDLHKNNNDDLHITASINIYLDVINLFVRFLRIVNKIKKTNVN